MTRLLPALAAVLIAAGTTACTTSADETVVVLSSWSGAEQDAFVNHVLAGFTKSTGIKVQHRQATRALEQELRNDLQTGHQPHVAILPSPGLVETFAAQGALHPLTSTQGGRYGTDWVSVDGDAQKSRYVVPVKGSLKSAIWFNPPALRRLLGQDWDGKPPATWTDLMSLTKNIVDHKGIPWCLGLESTPVSGWPGTDWIEDLLLRQAGPEAYQRWANGTLSWQSPEVAQALTAWGDIVDTIKSPEDALLTGFGAAGKSLFGDQPGCYLSHSAYIDNFANTLRPGDDFDFFPFPALNPQHATTREVSADFAAMFRQTPQAERLMEFLASADGQRIWPAIPGSAAFSPNHAVKPADYPDKVSRRMAEVLSEPGTVCFDASDLMPPSLSGAFNQAMLTFVSDPSHYRTPTDLNQLLATLDSVKTAAYTQDRTKFQCGQS